MIIEETKAGDMRCCGPEGCGSREWTGENAQSARFCIGSRCMAWRWLYDKQSLHAYLNKVDVDRAVSEGYKIVGYSHLDAGVAVELERRRETGYCGLSGKPGGSV